MSDKPRQSADPLYLLLREGRAEEFNRRIKAGESCDLRGCDFRGIDLRGVDVANLDLSDGYFRQADLRGLDLRGCKMQGASLHAAHISGVYFPAELNAAEIEISMRGLLAGSGCRTFALKTCITFEHPPMPCRTSTSRCTLRITSE